MTTRRAILFFGITCLTVFMSTGQHRTDRLLNFGWKFRQASIEGAGAVSFDDSQWQNTDLPHDASIYGPFLQDSLNSDRKNGFRPRLKGWYRKSLVIGNLNADKRYFLYFEGIYRDARVYLNGEQIAHQLNGYEAFEVAVTNKLKSGKNLIAVSYDNTDKESSRWYNGEGIYRDVWLKERSSVYVINDGTYVTTPFVTTDRAGVAIRTEVLNSTDETTEIMLTTGIYDPEGELVAEVHHVVPVAAGELYFFNQQLDVDQPLLWNVESPHLYIAKSRVRIGKEVVDEVTTRFGIRTIDFSPEQGLLVNGKKVLVKGVNIHHDLGPLGAAAFSRGFERRLEGLKKLGCNAIRLAHNPHDTFILDWCDANGMLVFDEAFDKWSGQFFGSENKFEDHWKKSLEAFIRRDRNHPSVFIWSVGNETRQQRSAASNFGVDQMRELADFVHQLEPARKVTCGLHPSRKSGAYRTENYYREGPPEMEFYMDVVSTNYREEFWPVDRANYPQLTFILSEAQVGNLGNEWFNFNHDYGVGLFYWGGTDYIGESFGWPAKGWPNGIIDWNDHWKPFSYYIQSLYSETPMVHITAYDPDQETNKYWNEVNLRFQPMFSHWNWEGKDSVKLMTFTNAREVELFINDQSMGVRQVPKEYYTKDIQAYSAEAYDPENPINTGPKMHAKLEWTVPYTPGEIRAVARNGKEKVAVHELKTATAPHHIVLEADRDQIRSDGLDLSYLTVKVVDKEGRLVPDATHEITFEVTGPGSNAGVGSADMISDEPFQSNKRKVFQGKALLIIRSQREKGIVKVKALAKGLQSANIRIVAD